MCLILPQAIIMAALPIFLAVFVVSFAAFFHKSANCPSIHCDDSSTKTDNSKRSHKKRKQRKTHVSQER